MENSTASNSTESIEIPEFKSDGYIAAGILGLTLLAVILGSLYLCFNKKLLGIRESFNGSTSTVQVPPERTEFLAAKERLDTSKPSELDELKKFLMRRAIRAIPILLSLQNEGNSIERLYKRGMLTDDMHFKVKDLKAFVDQEFQDVQFEAEDLLEGWAQQIWPQAMQFHTLIQKQAEERNAALNKTAAKAEEDSNQEIEIVKKEKKVVKAPVAVAKAPKVEKEAIIEPVTVVEEVVDPAVEAERMYQLLLAEEEDKKSNAKNGKNVKK